MRAGVEVDSARELFAEPVPFRNGAATAFCPTNQPNSVSVAFLSGTLRGNEDVGLNPLFNDDRSAVRSPFHTAESSLDCPAGGLLQGRRSSTGVFLSGIAVIAPDKVTDLEKITNLTLVR